MAAGRWGRVVLAALALGLSGGTALAQQAGEPLRFSLGTETFAVPLPDGYCVPQGSEVGRMQRVADTLLPAADTVLSLVSCGATANPLDYMIVIVPTDPKLQTRALSAVLAEPVFANPAPVPHGGPVGGAGHDDQCGYVGGTRILDGKPFSVAACATVFGGRTVSVMVTSLGDAAGAAIPSLKARARAFAVSVRPAK